MIRLDTVVGAIGGLIVGYVLWLLAISIAGDNATAGRWAPMILIVSAVLGLCAAVWGWQLRRRGRHPWAALAFGLPILPVVLTLAVLADIYA
jgi:cytochrome bd-type quinol oxidase subunit 1